MIVEENRHADASLNKMEDIQSGGKLVIQLRNATRRRSDEVEVHA
jgi:hypothetical protein